ncbi:hypothetical protein EMMF5_004780 [Cystobasidiomycetes sp. EMM_F5]
MPPSAAQIEPLLRKMDVDELNGYEDYTSIEHLERHEDVDLLYQKAALCCPPYAMNYKAIVAGRMQHANDVVQVCKSDSYTLDTLSEALLSAHTDSYDGELDDCLRLESTLLHWDGTPMLVIAGQRVDGDETMDELTAVIERTLTSSVLPDGTVPGHPYLRLLPGLPLLASMDVHADAASKGGSMPQQRLDAILKHIGLRKYVLHNNTSPLLLNTLLARYDFGNLQAVTYTCDLVLRGPKLGLGANAAWDVPAYFRVLKICKERNIPFLSIHGSFQGFDKMVLAELEGWSETMLRGVATKAEQARAQKMIRFGMAMPIQWAARVYGAASGVSGDSLRLHMHTLLANEGILPESSKYRPSDDWTAFALKGFDDYAEITPARAGSRLHSVAINADCPYCNTVGDLSGCTVDHAQIGEKTTIVEVINLEQVDNGDWKVTLGAWADMPTSNHFVVAYADQQATLDADWAAVRSARMAREAGPYVLVDDTIKEEWQKYTRIMLKLLEPATEREGDFPEYQRPSLHKTIENLKQGNMTKLCADWKKSSSLATTPPHLAE